ncbi:hypothetical protein [Ekhidna sp.]
MKSTLKSIAAITLTVLSVNFATAQKNDEVSFNNIDLKEVRKTFVNELLNDGLIERKKDDIHLELRSNTTVLNDITLTESYHQKYGDLAMQFKIDRGSYRVIYITKQCTAVGDLLDNSFSGKMHGKMSLDELTVSIR